MLKTKVEKMLGSADKMMDGMFKATGTNVLDAIAGTDESTMAMFVSACTMYAEAKECYLEAAGMMDTQKKMMEKLLERDERLLRQNNELIKRVKDLQGIQKMEKKGD